MNDGTIKGFVLDIQRFSLNDGPGMRSTVFLKGCPLRCRWCHSPETRKRVTELSVLFERCEECDIIGTAHCPMGVVHAATKPVPQLERDTIATVPVALSIEDCPQQAICRMGEWRTVRSVLADVEKDRLFFSASGGGMTVSGGEPMAQFRFTLALLRAARERGISTCLDTSGYATQEQFAAVLPVVDLFYYDYKATDPEHHRALTGVSNQTILANLDFLYQHGANIVLRAPLIPGVNDSPAHLQGIADLSRRYPDLIRVEILAYEPMREEKAARIGVEPLTPRLPLVSEKMKREWIDQLHQRGCERVVLQ